ncbi:unnamed protein product [Gordionus sp. m RMFG-2023]
MGQHFRIRYGQNLSARWRLYKGIKSLNLSCISKGIALKFDPMVHALMVSSNKSRTISSSHAFFKGFFSTQESCDFHKPYHNLSKKDIQEVLDTGTHQISSWIGNYLIIAPTKAYATRYSTTIDFLFTIFNYFECPNIARKIQCNLLNKNSTLLNYYLRNQDLMRILSENSGFKLDELVINANRLEDAFSCDFAENPEFLPDWIKRSTRANIFEEITTFAYLSCVNLLRFDRELLRHVIGVLVNHLIIDMKRKIDLLALFHSFNDSTYHTLDTKIINVYMAHDITLIALLTYLNISFSSKPSFSSAFVFELWFEDKLNDSNNHINMSRFTLKLYHKQSDEGELKHIENVKLIKFIESFQLLDLSKILSYLKSNC